jgi:hypothetical protein
MFVKRVSPPISGISTQYSSEPVAGRVVYDRSECQLTPVSRVLDGVPSAFGRVETMKISGYSGWRYLKSTAWSSSAPKRRLKSMCCCGVMSWPRMSTMQLSTQALRIWSIVCCASGRRRSTPWTSAPMP